MCQYFRLRLKKIRGRYVTVFGRFMKVLKKHKLWKWVNAKNLFPSLTKALRKMQATALDLEKRQTRADSK